MKQYKISEQGPTGRCHACGKLAFDTRRAAKRFMQRHFPGDSMSVYPCQETDNYHVGHTPAKVKHGLQKRGEGSMKRKPWMEPMVSEPNER